MTMPRAPRIPRAEVIALYAPDPALVTWRPWVVAGVGLGLVLAGVML
jgi:hypothetical protein